MTTADKAVPHDIEAERGVVASMLIDSRTCDDAAEVLRRDDFFDLRVGLIFEAAMTLHNDNRPVDVTTVVGQLRKAKQLDRAGGPAAVSELYQAFPTAAHVKHYASVVSEKSTLRSVIGAANSMLHEAYTGEGSAVEVLGLAESQIFGILEGRRGPNTRAIRDVLHEAMNSISDRQESGVVAGTPTGFVDLDAKVGGLRPRELTILAARPSMGKTALATNIAEHVSADQGICTLLVSLEMSNQEIGERMLGGRARVDSAKLRNGTLKREDVRAMIEAQAELAKAPLHIEDSASLTITQIAAIARRLKRRESLGLLVIDYLQLIHPENPKEVRQEQVSLISRRLKGLAKELGIPVLCLAQLNRQAENTAGNRPKLSHLRESGAIEQDADVVMFVHREEYYATKDEAREAVRGQADIIVAKNRNGPTGDLKLTWIAPLLRFENAAREPGDEPAPRRTREDTRRDLT